VHNPDSAVAVDAARLKLVRRCDVGRDPATIRSAGRQALGRGKVSKVLTQRDMRHSPNV